MNKFKFYFIGLMATVMIFSCEKDDNTITAAPLKDYKEQYTTENSLINDYLDEYYIFSLDDDFNVSFAPLIKTGKISASTDSEVIKGIGTIFTKEFMVGDDIYKNDDGTIKIGTILEINSDTQITLTSTSYISTDINSPIKCKVNKESIKSQKTFPLLTREVKFQDVDYVINYLVLRQGSKNPNPNPNVIIRGGESPCNTDSVLASYSGSYLKETTTTEGTTVSATFFEESKFPSRFLNLFPNALGQVEIRGWSEIFPKFKTGWYERNETNGKISFYDFGAGVMFIPSGLAYYNTGRGDIPAYVPLVFSFKLYEIDRIDTDGDGIYNFQEDLDGDGYMYSYTNKINYPNSPVNKDNSDTDDIPNFLDIDDDGDGFSTKLELKKSNGTYHTFESVPDCAAELDLKKKKRYLSAECKPPYID
jgi:hypothetical protein